MLVWAFAPIVAEAVTNRMIINCFIVFWFYIKFYERIRAGLSFMGMYIKSYSRVVMEIKLKRLPGLFSVFATLGEGVVCFVVGFVFLCVVTGFGNGFAYLAEVGTGGVEIEMEDFFVYVPHGFCDSVYAEGGFLYAFFAHFTAS